MFGRKLKAENAILKQELEDMALKIEGLMDLALDQDDYIRELEEDSEGLENVIEILVLGYDKLEERIEELTEELVDTEALADEYYKDFEAYEDLVEKYERDIEFARDFLDAIL